MPLPAPLRGTRATAVAAELRRMIQSGELPPGTRLRQTEIAERYGVSTTPVREALTALSRQGLIKHDTHRGAVVFVPSIEDVHENYEIRIALEPLATQLAAENLTDPELDEIEAITERFKTLMTSIRAGGAVPIEYVVLDGEFHRAIVAGSRRPRLTEIIDALRDTADGYPQVANARQTDGFMERSQSDHEQITTALRARDGERAGRLAREHLEFALSRL
ncbi:MAG TPA: GntR family transcriptional regulator [Baekduia sp.]|nr:GntR family transcriptional regulator [Baekduia sp.]